MNQNTSGKTITKAELIERVYERIGFSKKESADLVELMFDLMKNTLAEGEKIKISGFGNFVVRAKRSRAGRNPQTGESIQISSRKVLTFRPSQVLKNALNATKTSHTEKSHLGGSTPSENSL